MLFFLKDQRGYNLEGVKMPLTAQVRFKTRLQTRNRIQVSKYIRRHFKLETDQYLKAYVRVLGIWGNPQTFLTKIDKDDRIVIPKLTASLLPDRKIDLTGYVLEVTLDPL